MFPTASECRPHLKLQLCSDKTHCCHPKLSKWAYVLQYKDQKSYWISPGEHKMKRLPFLPDLFGAFFSWNRPSPSAFISHAVCGSTGRTAWTLQFQTDQVLLNNFFFFPLRLQTRSGREHCEENGNWQRALTSNSLISQRWCAKLILVFWHLNITRQLQKGGVRVGAVQGRLPAKCKIQRHVGLQLLFIKWNKD